MHAHKYVYMNGKDLDDRSKQDDRSKADDNDRSKQPTLIIGVNKPPSVIPCSQPLPTLAPQPQHPTLEIFLHSHNTLISPEI
jgi:hypothetical protein